MSQLSQVSNTMEIVSVIQDINHYFNALDAKEFDVCLHAFSNKFDADYTSMVGGEPMIGLPKEANLHAWNGMMAGFKSTHHLVGNHHVVIVNEFTAQLTMKVTATHVFDHEDARGEEIWVCGGTYNMTLRKEPSGVRNEVMWKILKIKFSQNWKQGSEQLIAEATARCVARNTAKTENV